MIGRPLLYTAEYGHFQPQIEDNWREAADPALAPGVTTDLGAHLVDQAIDLFGPVESVWAEIAARRDDARVPDDVLFDLRHKNGVSSRLRGSVIMNPLAPARMVQGSQGGFVIQGRDTQTDALLAGELPGTHPWGRPVPAQYSVAIGAAIEQRDAVSGDWPAYYAEVKRALDAGDPLPVNPRESLAALRVIDAAKMAAGTGAVVQM